MSEDVTIEMLRVEREALRAITARRAAEQRGEAFDGLAREGDLSGGLSPCE